MSRVNPYRRSPKKRGGFSLGAVGATATPQSTSLMLKAATPATPASPPSNGGKMPKNDRGHCGLPTPRPDAPEDCADLPGQQYCRGHMGGFVDLAAAGAAGDTATITLSPVNAVSFVARWLHMTATSAPAVSPVTFTQAFTVSNIAIVGDNQLANLGPVIGSTWSDTQTYLEVFWTRYITPTNPLSITVSNIDTGLAIRVFASVAGDFIK